MEGLTDVDAQLAQAQVLNEKIALSHPLEKLPEEADVDRILTAMEQVVDHFQTR